MNPYITQNPFLNPIYGNYMQQQPIQQIGISGKYVNDFNEITASDIPMNSPAIFAKNDRSEVQIREWNANGQITTTCYKRETAPEPKEDTMQPIIDRLISLEEKIDKMQKPMIPRKKEGE